MAGHDRSEGTVLAFAISTFTTLFFVVDPPATLPLFIAMTKGDTPAHKRSTAARAALIAATALCVFAGAGHILLESLGISLAAFRMAGGILLFLLAVDMLRAEPSRQRSTPEEEAEGSDKSDVSVFPLAIPMLAGPGSIASVMMFMARAETVAEHAVVFGAILFVCGVTFVLLRSATALERRLGKTGLNVTQRIMGIILAASATQFVVDGAREAFGLQHG